MSSLWKYLPQWTHNSQCLRVVLPANTIQDLTYVGMHSEYKSSLTSILDSCLAITPRSAGSCRIRGVLFSYMVYLGVSPSMRTYARIRAVCVYDKPSHLVATRSHSAGRVKLHVVRPLPANLVHISDTCGWRLSPIFHYTRR